MSVGNTSAPKAKDNGIYPVVYYQKHKKVCVLPDKKQSDPSSISETFFPSQATIIIETLFSIETHCVIII